MHQSDDQDQEQSENWLGTFELECVNQLQSEPNLEETMVTERGLSEKQLFLMFQDSASAISQLYKDHYQVAWLPFQNAALAVTNLYKECVSRLQHCVELGQATGRYTRTRDLLAWARKKRRNIRRDELLAYLSGRTLPPRRSYNAQSGRRHSLSLERSLPRHHSLSASNTMDANLDSFEQALALQGRNGTVPDISVGYHSHSPSAQPMEDLDHYNSLEEYACFRDLRKRPTQPHDCIHDSPARKRSRLL